MPTRNVVLTERQETLIEALIESGRYENADEVMGDGLRLIESREIDDATKLEALRAAVRLGLSSLERGEFREFADVTDLIAHLNRVAERDADSESR